jgi:hypothetical protein
MSIGGIFLIFMGIFFICESAYFVKTGRAFIPIIAFYRKENPIIFWSIVISFLIFGLLTIIGTFLSIIFSK